MGILPNPVLGSINNSFSGGNPAAFSAAFSAASASFSSSVLKTLPKKGNCVSNRRKSSANFLILGTVSTKNQ